MEIIKLKARQRTGAGKSYTRKARVAGWIPAVFYGEGHQTQPIEVDKKEFAAIVRNRKLTHLVDLGLSEGATQTVAVIREVQRDVVRDENFLHVDFQGVVMDRTVIVECPLELVGLPVGVKNDAGVLGRPVRKLTIECMPMLIPEKITVDVSGLGVGDSIHVRDLNIPDVTIKDSPDEVVAVVTMPTREEAVTTTEAAATAEGAAAPAAEAAKGGTPKGGAPKEKGK